MGFVPLPLKKEHILRLRSLSEWEHRNPFDRMLVAQAEAEKIHFLTEDKKILTAAASGHVTVTEGRVSVSDVLQLENVDVATGNIDFDGSILVLGNVNENFSVCLVAPEPRVNVAIGV